MIWALLWASGILVGALGAWIWLSRATAVPARPDLEEAWDEADRIDAGGIELEEMRRIRKRIAARQSR